MPTPTRLALLLGTSLIACGGSAAEAPLGDGERTNAAEEATRSDANAPPLRAPSNNDVPAEVTAVGPARCPRSGRVLASFDGGVGPRLVVADGAIYVAASARSADETVSHLYRVDKVSGVAIAEATSPVLELLGASDDAIVWSTGTERALHRRRFVTHEDLAMDVALGDYSGVYGGAETRVTAHEVVFADRRTRDGSFLTVPAFDDVIAAPTVHSLPTSIPTSWVSDGTSLYWLADGGLWRAGIDDATNARRIHDAPAILFGANAKGVFAGLPRGADVDVIAIDKATAAKRGVAARAPAPSSQCEAGKYGLAPITVTDDEHVYGVRWTDCLDRDRAHFALAELSREGTSEAKVLGEYWMSLLLTTAIATDDACVYYTVTESDALARPTRTTLHAVAR